MENKIKTFSQMIRDCDEIVFFGGAGVSTESGIKDYRSKDGLYNTVNEYGVSPETILSRSFFDEHPDVFYDFYRKYFMVDAEPNEAHRFLARLEDDGKLTAVITQNIDGLHQRAGSCNVLELRGTAYSFRCTSCHTVTSSLFAVPQIADGKVPRCESCGGVLKPNVVFYGERLNDDVISRAIDHVRDADMLIVGGTSLAVYPAASLIDYFAGKYIVLINKTETTADNRADLVINGSIGEIMSKTAQLLSDII